MGSNKGSCNGIMSGEGSSGVKYMHTARMRFKVKNIWAANRKVQGQGKQNMMTTMAPQYMIMNIRTDIFFDSNRSKRTSFNIQPGLDSINARYVAMLPKNRMVKAMVNIPIPQNNLSFKASDQT